MVKRYIFNHSQSTFFRYIRLLLPLNLRLAWILPRYSYYYPENFESAKEIVKDVHDWGVDKING